MKNLFPLIATLCLCALQGQALSTATAQPLQWDRTSKTAIVLPNNPSLPEKTAAKELGEYLTKATGGQFTVQTENAATRPTASAVYVGNTQFARRSRISVEKLAAEEWQIKTQNGNLILLGNGSRGTLYATYRFLEDVVGVRWWNPWEEKVPATGKITVPALDKRGKPSFAYRDIYMLYGNDNGRFAIRNRLNRDGDAAISAEYGGSRDYGPPYHVHTFYKILPPEKYYEAHPEWFIISNGEKPTYINSQLAMSNPAMRQEFLKQLRKLIRQSHKEAREKGLPVPDVFSVSQEDNRVSFATLADKELLEKNDGAESAILLDFVNYLADSIRDEFPEVYIDTLAYYSGEKAPTNIRPRDNVIIRLTDTTSNLLLPVTHPRNHDFHDNVVAWGKITKNLRVWDYAVTYAYPGLPMPTTRTYQPDYQFFKANNVEGVFTEHEYPILADIRDLKVWLQCKLLEDPNQNYNALVQDFTDGFYGPAGVHVRRYLDAIDQETDRMGQQNGYEDISWYVPPKIYNYLSLDFVLKANAIFDAAAIAAQNDATYARRVRHARLSLDRFMALFHTQFTKHWMRKGNTAQTMPLSFETISARYAQAWNEQTELRIPADQQAREHTALQNELKKLATVSPYRDKIPEFLKDIPAENITVYGPRETRNYNDIAKVIADPEAPIGEATRYEIPLPELEKYKIPMTWGLYDVASRTTLLTHQLRAEEIPGPGFHWYRFSLPLSRSHNPYMYLFWSWNIQVDLNLDFDDDKQTQEFEVWANLKFSGPNYPHGKATDKNAISVERVVLVKK